MYIKKAFKKIKLPLIYNEHNNPKYLDPFRKRLVSITNEEDVRQKTACYMRDILNVPEHLIATEEHLSHYGIDSNDRADIVITEVRDNGEYPLAVIECKSESVGLSAQAVEQVLRYADALDARYTFVCDGVEMFCYESESYSKLEKIPSYSDMLIQNYSLAKFHEEEYSRTPFELLANEQSQDRKTIGEDTPQSKKSHIKNIAEALMDCSHKAYSVEYDGLKILEDLGLSYRRYGDASGSDFGTGNYRMLLTENKTGETMIYGFSIQATGKTINDPHYHNQSGKSVLIVSVSGEKKDVMLVQLNLNDFLNVAGKEIHITHNGKVSMKYASIEEFKERITSCQPDLLNHDQIFLGALPKDELLYLDMECMMQLLVNLIRYCNIRDEYKQYLSKKRKANRPKTFR